ncbi:MAG: AMP-binding protein [Candidatus Latescibacteria bacterium]|nr:AMP-binding protein [Candidatus Latescibacterota bacterium]
MLKAGCVFVVINSSLKAKQLRYILNNSGVKLLITHLDKAHVAEDALYESSDKCRVLWIGDPDLIPQNLTSKSVHWKTVFSNSGEITELSENKHDVLGDNRCIDLDLAALVYISGLTGVPKGVMSSHRNMI